MNPGGVSGGGVNPPDDQVTGAGQDLKIHPTFAEDENDPQVLGEWYTHLIDEVTAEVLEVSKMEGNGVDKSLHVELLESRGRAILLDLGSIYPRQLERLTQVLEQVQLLRQGEPSTPGSSWI